MNSLEDTYTITCSYQDGRTSNFKGMLPRDHCLNYFIKKKMRHHNLREQTQGKMDTYHAKQQHIPAKAPLERSVRSRKAKKSLFSKRQRLGPTIAWIRDREGQRIHASILLRRFLVSRRWAKIGTLQYRCGFTALTHNIGCQQGPGQAIQFLSIMSKPSLKILNFESFYM